MKNLILIVHFIGLVFCVSCFEFVPTFDVDETEGYQPIYTSAFDQIVMLDVREVHKPGQIYSYGQYILLEERGTGFHIIDNLDPTKPQKVGFFQIPLNQNIAIRGNTIYADSGSDLLAIEVSTDESLAITRLDGAFSIGHSKLLPPESGYYFECVQADKGEIIGWKKLTIKNPQCYF